MKFVLNEQNTSIECLIAALSFVRTNPEMGPNVSADLERVELAIQRVCKRLHMSPLTRRQFNLALRYLSQELIPKEWTTTMKMKKKVRKFKSKTNTMQIKRVKRVKLPPDTELEVVVPTDHAPVFVPPVPGNEVARIVPVPVELKRKWWWP